ncbi:NlpC/P60 family protein [Leuconostoc litchii]|uniref:Gamma-glutamyl-diamino acid-endopeptidase n=2 Tax=Leuconostoc litchii TaxID=1981069 RepID=A0A652NE87_9LACO|nr:NlpC/P60 family protein [Leuconostoc litchii]TYC46506.1 gamma-glutamyl-diamino acid-endopeptidase [Leuconostoc litchii]
MKLKRRASRYKVRKRKNHMHSLVIVIPAVAFFMGLLIVNNVISLPKNIKEIPTQVLRTTLLKTVSLKDKSQNFTTVSGEKVTMKTTTFGKTYLISDETKKKLTGLQTIGKKEYYFSPTNGEMVYGLKKIDGYFYYFDEDGANNSVTAYQKVADSVKSDNTTIEKVISGGMALVGKSAYSYGGGRTSSSIAKNEFDCSSFIAWFYRKAGLPLVVQSAASTTLLAQTGTAVNWSDMKRGDVLVTPNTYTEDRLHTAIYLGNGFILHDAAPTDGVAISRLNELVNYKSSKTLTWADLLKPGTVRREVTE